MKWFRHMTNARRDPVVVELCHRFGHGGYRAFFTILELMGENLDTRIPGKIHLNWRQISEETGLYRKSLQSILIFLQEQNKFAVEWDDEKVLVYCPKFKEFADSYTQEVLRKSAQSEVPELLSNCSKYVPEQKRREEKEESTLLSKGEGRGVNKSGQQATSIGDVLKRMLKK